MGWCDNSHRPFTSLISLSFSPCLNYIWLQLVFAVLASASACVVGSSPAQQMNYSEYIHMPKICIKSSFHNLFSTCMRHHLYIAFVLAHSSIPVRTQHPAIRNWGKHTKDIVRKSFHYPSSLLLYSELHPVRSMPTMLNAEHVGDDRQGGRCKRRWSSSKQPGVADQILRGRREMNSILGKA